MKLEQYKEIECLCSTCQEMCKRPCWGTPQEIKRIIDAGFSEHLMLDKWLGVEYDIEILCGALKEFECKESPWIARTEKGCTFWKNNLCELHNEKLKPCEGRFVSHDESYPTLHKEVAMTWDTQEGKNLVKEWKEKYLLRQENAL